MSGIHIQYALPFGFPVGSDQQAKPILAERFKTKFCQNYVVHGVCPYEIRCMFAHGDAELRTKEMNLAAGLTTEEAIKRFQRDRMIAARHEKKRIKLARKAAEAAAAAAAAAEKMADETVIAVDPASPKAQVQMPPPKPLNVTSLMSLHDDSVQSGGSSPNEEATPATVPAAKSPLAVAFGALATPHTPPRSPGGLSDSGLTPNRRFRHDPYSPSTSQLTPLIGTSSTAGTPLLEGVAAAVLPRSRSRSPLTLPALSTFTTPCKHSQLGACNTGTKPVSPLAAAMMRRHHASDPDPEPAYCTAEYHASRNLMAGDVELVGPVPVADDILLA